MISRWCGGGRSALIGATGFVGTTLLRTRSFDDWFRSTDIDSIRGRSYDEVVCAAAPAQKWIANRDPDSDRAGIERLATLLDTVTTRRFTLVSTVDVFREPVGVDESSPVEEAGLHPYGLHRRWLEKFVEEKFADRCVVRLPGLVGPGLRKNALFDLHNGNNVSAIDARATFQFYPMVNLAADLERAWSFEVPLLHFSTEPVSMQQVARAAFDRGDLDDAAGPAPRYDMRSRFARQMGGAGHYVYDARTTMLAIRAYAQSEPRAGAHSE